MKLLIATGIANSIVFSKEFVGKISEHPDFHVITECEFSTFYKNEMQGFKQQKFMLLDYELREYNPEKYKYHLCVYGFGNSWGNSFIEFRSHPYVIQLIENMGDNAFSKYPHGTECEIIEVEDSIKDMVYISEDDMGGEYLDWKRNAVPFINVKTFTLKQGE